MDFMERYKFDRVPEFEINYRAEDAVQIRVMTGEREQFRKIFSGGKRWLCERKQGDEISLIFWS